MKVYFTRHGQPVTLQPTEDPDYPVGNPYLSELGRQQARLLGERLKAETDIKCIYASPYLRTMDTATIIAEVIDVPVYPDARFREMTMRSTRNLYGHTIDELKARYPQIAADAPLPHPWWTTEEEPPDENYRRPDILKRVTELIEEIRGRSNDDFLLVGHGATVASTYHYLLDRQSAPSDHPTIYNWNCSLFSATLAPEVTISLLDDTSHLPPDSVTSNSQPKDVVLAKQ